MPERYRALVLLLGFGGLRFGEATALRRNDVTMRGALVSVERSVRYINGEWVVGPPKTDAGRCTVALPAFVARAVQDQLAKYAHDGPDAVVFGTRRAAIWQHATSAGRSPRAVARCGLPPARVHWLRHTGATLAASTGATTKELMHRLEHVSSTAALGYQHAASSRDSEIARALDALGSP